MLDTEKIYQLAWYRAANQLGYTIQEELFSRLVGLRTEDCEALILDALGASFPLDEFHRRWMEHWIEEADRSGIDVKPGLFALLNRIDALGIPKAVATSSTRPEAVRSLRLGSLDMHFSIVVTGDDVEQGKPAPDIFLEAARRLGVPPGECMAFEDSSAGAMSAAAAGMAVYIVPDLNAPTDQAASVAGASYRLWKTRWPSSIDVTCGRTRRELFLSQIYTDKELIFTDIYQVSRVISVPSVFYPFLSV